MAYIYGGNVAWDVVEDRVMAIIGIKTLPEHTQTYCKIDHHEQTSVIFGSKYSICKEEIAVVKVGYKKLFL